MKKPEIAVIGAGIIGLTTAISAQEQLNAQVTIYTDKHPLQTTSAKAGASFKPHKVVYDTQAHTMAQLTGERYTTLTADPSSGVRKHIHWEASSIKIPEPDYLDLMEDVDILTQEIPGQYPFALRYRTFLIDTPKHLRWLISKFLTAGGQFNKKEFETAQDLQNLPQDLIFNCTGLGSRKLFNDTDLIAVKGQIAVVNALPEMDWSISADGFYIYPRENETILGGTTEEGIDNEQADPGAIQLIVRGNQRVLSNLHPNQVIRSYAGIRPFRSSGIRVQAQENNRQRIIHHYGHGGSGYTLSWGSAQKAITLT